jgi:hypothetical protein
MVRKLKIFLTALLAVWLCSGCAMRTVDQMYAVPKRSAEYHDLQIAIDVAMEGIEYCAPLSGENRQAVQMADLDGDGQEEYILFARENSDHPLKIFIFNRADGQCTLRETVESQGTGFELVEYVDIDGKPGRVDLHMASLKEYIRTCKKYEKIAVLELKNSFTDDELRNIYNEINEENYVSGTIFIAFDINNLLGLRKIDATVGAQFLTKAASDGLVKLLTENKLDLDYLIEIHGAQAEHCKMTVTLRPGTQI